MTAAISNRIAIAHAEPLNAVQERVLLIANMYGAAHRSFTAKELMSLVRAGGEAYTARPVAGALLFLANRNHLLKIAAGEFARLPQKPAAGKSMPPSSIKPLSPAQLMAGRAR